MRRVLVVLSLACALAHDVSRLRGGDEDVRLYDGGDDNNMHHHHHHHHEDKMHNQSVDDFPAGGLEYMAELKNHLKVDLIKAKHVILESSDCKSCMVGGIKTFLMSAVELLHEACEKPCCRKMEFICHVAKEHPGVAMGAMIFQLRPPEFVFAGCLTANKCLAEDEGLLRDPEMYSEETGGSWMAADPQFIAELSEGLSAAMSSAPSFSEGIDFHHADDEIPETVCDCEDDVPSGHHFLEHCHGCPCMKCVHIATKAAAMGTWKIFKHGCHHAKDDTLYHHICEHAKEHPKIAFGFVTAAVAPWKFAAGYCTGSGFCPQWNHHHHRMELHHPHHHWDHKELA